MFQFYEMISGFFSTIVDFVWNMFVMLGHALVFIGQGVTCAIAYIVYLPPWILPFVSAVIAWAVLSFIINR